MKRFSLSPYPDLDLLIEKMEKAETIVELSAVRKRFLKKLKTKPETCNKGGYLMVSNSRYFSLMFRTNSFVRGLSHD